MSILPTPYEQHSCTLDFRFVYFCRKEISVKTARKMCVVDYFSIVMPTFKRVSQISTILAFLPKRTTSSK
jgi:hypothetical protein